MLENLLDELIRKILCGLCTINYLDRSIDRCLYETTIYFNYTIRVGFTGQEFKEIGG